MDSPKARIVESVPVRDFHELYGETLQLELVAGEKGLNKVIREKSINRPALALTGYYKYFANKRIQLCGAGEMGYLRDLKEAKQKKILEGIAKLNIPCLIVSRNLAPPTVMMEVAEDFRVPLFRTPQKSKDFIAEATVLLEHQFAPQITLHGTLIDVKGIGVLLRGKSGVGKSECALALIERGHSLVADDITYCKRITDIEIEGTSSELNRGYMECRGIGIINIAEMFGIRSVRLQKRIDLVVTFLEWKPGMNEERTGLEENFYRILDINIPHVEIPVRSGRDIARLTEVAALIQALKRIGHDSAKEFNERLIASMVQE